MRYSVTKVAASRGLKLCRKCRVEKPIDAFPFNKAAQKPYSPCLDCDTKRQRAAYRRRLAERGPWVHPSAWSAEDNEKLRLMILAGRSSGECAEALGRTVGSVHDRRIKLGYPKFKRPRSKPVSWTPDRVAELVRLRGRGASYHQCAFKLKTTRGSIAHAIACYVKEDKPDAKPLPDMRPANRAAAVVSLPKL